MVSEVIWSFLKPRGVPRSNESDGASLTGLGSVALDSRRLHCRLLKRSQDQRDLKQVLASIRTRGSIGLRSQDNLRPRCIAHLSGFGGRYNSRSLPSVPVQRDGRSRQQSTDVPWFSIACITKFLGPVLAAPLRILSLPHRDPS